MFQTEVKVKTKVLNSESEKKNYFIVQLLYFLPLRSMYYEIIEVV